MGEESIECCLGGGQIVVPKIPKTFTADCDHIPGSVYRRAVAISARRPFCQIEINHTVRYILYQYIWRATCFRLCV